MTKKTEANARAREAARAKAADSESSEDLRARIKSQGISAVVAFSRGKDAIAALLALRESGVDAPCYHLDLVPGLRFVDESLSELERQLGISVLRMPHPSFYRWLHEHTFRPPEECSAVERSTLWGCRWEYRDVYHAARVELGKTDALIATGVRSADSPVRRVSLLRHGPVSRDGLAHVVWDWRADDVEAIIRRHGVRLPVDYELFGRSFDGIDARFVGPLKASFPDDYERIRWWFPMVDAELHREAL